jgi:hypothetical protein
MTLEQLIEIAKEVEVADPFDWADLNINEDDAYRLIALGILEKNLTPEIMLATIVKLCVENLVLNLRLLQNETKVP